jgi:peptide/nickel transport system ATP-binding protein
MLNVNIKSVSIVNEGQKSLLLLDINFNIECGKIYTILGKNGSGKSTLIKSITKLLPSDQYEVEGKIIFNNTKLLNASEYGLRAIRRNKIRYVFQDVMNSFDPLRKLNYYFNLSKADVSLLEEHLEFFLLPDYKKISKLYPYELSGGMAQRILFILALLANPDLIILDEPTSGVDYAITNLILLKLKEYTNTNEKSALVVTQDINFALQSSDYISFLSDGTMTNFFTIKEFTSMKDNSELNSFLKSFKELQSESVNT